MAPSVCAHQLGVRHSHQHLLPHGGPVRSRRATSAPRGGGRVTAGPVGVRQRHRPAEIKRDAVVAQNKGTGAAKAVVGAPMGPDATPCSPLHYLTLRSCTMNRGGGTRRRIAWGLRPLHGVACARRAHRAPDSGRGGTATPLVRVAVSVEAAAGAAGGAGRQCPRSGDRGPVRLDPAPRGNRADAAPPGKAGQRG